MSQEFMDPEIFVDFIVEAKEHLETIEPNLLELEKNPGNLGLLNEIFRPMHSLKGASGFLGLNCINGLAHKAENILDELRKGNMQVTSGIMDVILAATDALRTMIENLESTSSEGDVNTAPIISRIEALLAGEGQAEAAAPAAPEAASEPETAAMEGTQADQAPETETTDEPESPGAPQFELVVNGPAYALTAIGADHLNDFLEEARETIENLNSSLVELEGQADEAGEMVNDIFRYFHNIKGNSGIIGHKELNALTHEAETLLNKVRKGEMRTSRPMVDLLLASVDMMEALIKRIDLEHIQATPLDISPLTERLQMMSSGQEPAPLEPAPAAAPAPEEAKPAAAKTGDAQAKAYDPEDLLIFEQTVEQQQNNIKTALSGLDMDDSNKDFVDGLFRSLVALQNSAGYMGFDDLKVYAERTAALVDQGRKSGLPFSALLDLLTQECAILEDKTRLTIERIKASAISALEAEIEAPGQAAAPKPAAVAPAPAPEAPKPVPAQAAPAAPKPAAPAPKPAPAPEAPKPAAAAPKPAAPAAAPKPAAPPAAPKPAPAPAAAKAAPAPADAGEAGKPKVSATIRVDHEKLDHLMNLIGELIINRNRFALLARSLEESKAEVSDIAQQLTESTYAMARISDELQDTIMKVRMVPVSTVFSRFPRLVRDLSRKSAKEVNLVLEGEETELDKSVVEVIGDPLVHLIRNSVDHGLESEEDRLAAGKPAVGHVWLRAYHRGNSVAIEVEDDGKGIDPAKMREVGVRKGIVTPEEAKQLDDRAAIELIFAPGFSSAEKITDISGRGVGMDVVRTNIKNLKGTVNVTSEIGKGTRFTLALPLTLAIIDALMVTVAGDTYAIPLDSVSETTKIEVKRMTEVNKRKAVTLRGEVLGVVDLREVLEMPPHEDDREIVPIVILQDNERRLGIIVDTLLERQEIVIKPLGAYLNEFDMKGISGATIMGDGSVVLILDPHEVYVMAVGAKAGH